MKITAPSIWLLSGALLVTPTVSWGQDLRVSVSGGETVDALGYAGRGATLQSELVWATPLSTSRLGAFGSVTEGAGMTGGLFGSGDAVLMRAGPLDLRLSTAGAGAGNARFLAARGTGGLALRLSGRHLGVEGGPLVQFAAERRTPGASGPLPFDSSPTDGISSRHSIGGRAALLAAGGPFSSRVEWTQSSMRDGARWTDWTAALGLQTNRASIAVDLGTRAEGSDERWAAVQLAVPVGDALQITGQVGTFASDPVALRPAGRWASAGINWSSGPSGQQGFGGARRPLVPEALPAGVTRFTLRAEPGTHVELLADWAGWMPQPLNETRPGRYEIDVELSPGIHRFAYRVDGDWTVPPGYPTEADDYGSRRAIVRVE